MINKTYDKKTYTIAHNGEGGGVVHPSVASPGVTFSTGQPYLEEFDSELEWKTRLEALGYKASKLNSKLFGAPAPAPEPEPPAPAPAPAPAPEPEPQAPPVV